MEKSPGDSATRNGLVVDSEDVSLGEGAPRMKDRPLGPYDTGQMPILSNIHMPTGLNIINVQL